MSTASDNTAKWAVRKFGGAGLPVGFEYFTTNPNIPAGSLPLLGGVYSRTLYKDLWNWVQEQTGYLIEESEWQEKSAANEGNVPFYSTGDGTTTFRVPSLKCWVKGANGIEEVGSYLSAGLPNITGEVHSADWGSWNDPVGGLGDSALYYPYNSNTHGPGSGGTAQKNHGVAIDASRSNSIYGNSDTVQPKSIVGMWLVKAYGTVTNVGNTDVANIAQGLTELENRVTPIANGGTGATNASQARTNLGLGSVATENTVPISKGGTGATTPEQARENLGLGSMALEDNAIVNATISGKVITLTFADGTTKSLTMQGATFMPNYGSYVQISTGDYTPTSNGIIIVNHHHDGDYQTIKVVHKSSGLEIFRNFQTRYPGDFTSWCLVAKSETYTISVSGGSSTVYFCPMKEG